MQSFWFFVLVFVLVFCKLFNVLVFYKIFTQRHGSIFFQDTKEKPWPSGENLLADEGCQFFGIDGKVMDGKVIQ